MTIEETKAKLLWDSECDRFCDRCSYEKCQVGIARLMAVEALEKQIPKKPVQKKFNVGYRFIRVQDYYTCPACGALVEVDDNEGYMSEYYPACRCGQLIDWNGIIDICDMKWLDEYEVI